MNWSAQAALGELLARLAATRGATVYVTDNELAGWPQTFVAQVKTIGLLTRASPASDVVCSGCERECAMPVEVLSNDGCGAAAFIVCDKRSDINRVKVPLETLSRWKASGASLAGALSQLLALAPRAQAGDTSERWPLGMLAGSKHKDRLALHAGDGGLTLAVAGHAVSVDDLMTVADRSIEMDRVRLVRLVDQPTGRPAAESETADERSQRLLARRLELKARGVRSFLKVMATEEGVSTSALKQVMARRRPPADAIAEMADVLSRPVSRKEKSKR